MLAHINTATPPKCVYNSMYSSTFGELLYVDRDIEIDSLVRPTCRMLKKNKIKKKSNVGLHEEMLSIPSWVCILIL